MKTIRFMMFSLLLVMLLTSCSNPSASAVVEQDLNQSNASAESISDLSKVNPGSETAVVAVEDTEGLDWPNFDEEDLNTDLSTAEFTVITLSGSKVTVQGEGVQISGTIVTITSAGGYQVSGSLAEGQIIVEASDEDLVHLLFNDVEIYSSTDVPVLVQNADKTVITLAAGTENVVTDDRTELLEDDDEPNAAIFSNDDLTINGSGSLIVNGNAAHGIACDDDLKIVSGGITINASKDGIQGRDSIAVMDGSVMIEAGSDGLQSDNDEDAGEGNIFIEGGVFKITSEHDGIQAVNILAIRNGKFDIISGGGRAEIDSGIMTQWGDWDRQEAASDSDISAKGLKTGAQLYIFGGDFQINSADDTVHSDGVIRILGGVFELASGDDGVHADTLLGLEAGTIEITQSYEGVESTAIIINGGSLSIISADDGVNGSTGDSNGVKGGRQGGGNFGGGDGTLTVNGGYVYINAGGDGIDINGSIEMTNGTVLVNGPTESMNGAVDYLGSFKISGGLFVAVGSIGMAEAPSADSTQAVLMYNFTSPQGAGTLFHVDSASGESIISFVPAKNYQSVVVSSPDFEMGETYMIYTGGSAEGYMVDGLFVDAVYSPGSQVESFNFSEMVTILGAVGRMGGQDGMPAGGVDKGGEASLTQQLKHVLIMVNLACSTLLHPE